MRKVIEMENQGTLTPASEWESEDWEKFEVEIRSKQKMLIDLGVVKLLCNLIAYESKLTIMEEAMLVSIACLLGGNYDTQQSFVNYINEDQSNQFIISLKNMLKNAFESVKNT